LQIAKTRNAHREETSHDAAKRHGMVLSEQEGEVSTLHQRADQQTDDAENLASKLTSTLPSLKDFFSLGGWAPTRDPRASFLRCIP
jgi:hypothetical protein